MSRALNSAKEWYENPAPRSARKTGCDKECAGHCFAGVCLYLPLDLDSEDPVKIDTPSTGAKMQQEKPAMVQCCYRLVL